MNVEMLPTPDTSTQKFIVRISLISNPDSDLGLFIALTVEKKEMVVYDFEVTDFVNPTVEGHVKIFSARHRCSGRLKYFEN